MGGLSGPEDNIQLMRWWLLVWCWVWQRWGGLDRSGIVKIVQMNGHEIGMVTTCRHFGGDAHEADISCNYPAQPAASSASAPSTPAA